MEAKMRWKTPETIDFFNWKEPGLSQPSVHRCTFPE